MQHQLLLAQDALARAALVDLLDGSDARDLQMRTGHDLAYCEEIISLLSAPPGTVRCVDAFLAAVDGADVEDILGATGLSAARCKEIINLRNELMPR
mgnify:CR=1 FL=1